MNEDERNKVITQPNAVIYIGDCLEDYDSHDNELDDTEEKLTDAAKHFGKPIITLLDRAPHTNDRSIVLMNQVSERTKVYGCPIEVGKSEWDIRFTKEIIPIIIASAGPEALAEATKKGIIKQKDDSSMPYKRLQSIAKAAKKRKKARPNPAWHRRKRKLPAWIPVALFSLGVTLAGYFGKRAAPPPVQATPEPQENVVPLPKTTALYFKHNSAELSPHNVNVLDSVSAFIAANPDTKAILHGSASTPGSDDYNMNLSLQRALNAQQVVIDSEKVGEERVSAAGFGEQFADEDDASNRRLDIYIYNVETDQYILGF